MQQKRKAQSEKLIELYNLRLEQAVTLFYEQVGDDEVKNQEMFDDFNQAWKKVTNAVNRTQKHTTINPFAFEKQIEKYKQIALQRAIKQVENGEEQNQSPIGTERETEEIL